MATLDTEIDQLYQLPLSEFTAARNALARGRPKAEAAQVKQLPKPTLVAWAVNRLFWTDRTAWTTLMRAGRALRDAQVAALEGRTADVRTSTTAHRDALSAATARAVALASPAHPAPDQVARMLEAVSLAGDPPQHPGRFADAIQLSGFEALAGITPAGRPATPPPPSPQAPRGGTTGARPPKGPSAAQRRREEQAAARARQAAREAAREALARAQRTMDEALAHEARAAQDVDKARERLAHHEAALDAARQQASRARDVVADAQAAFEALGD